MTRIGLIGDNHGHWQALADASAALCHDYGCTSAIQVGDCGFSLATVASHAGVRLALPVLAIDGNHEDHDLLHRLQRSDPANDPWKAMGLSWVRRGEVRVLAGLCVAFIGGAVNADAQQLCWPVPRPGAPLPVRAEHATYPLEDDADRLCDNLGDRSPDLVISHSCPAGIGVGLRGYETFDWSMSAYVRERGLDCGPSDDRGEPALRYLWQRLSADGHRPRWWIFGHWHVDRETRVGGTRFLTLPPCDPEMGLWRPCWYDTERNDVMVGTARPLG
jgi:hypothetical protein